MGSETVLWFLENMIALIDEYLDFWENSIIKVGSIHNNFLIFFGFIYKKKVLNHVNPLVSSVMNDLLADLGDNIRWIDWCYQQWAIISAKTLTRRLQEVCSNIACIFEDESDLINRCTLYDEYRIFRMNDYFNYVDKKSEANNVLQKNSWKYDMDELKWKFQNRNNYWWFKPLFSWWISQNTLIRKYNLSTMSSIFDYCFQDIDKKWKLNQLFNRSMYSDLSLFAHPNWITRWMIPQDQKWKNNIVLFYSNENEQAFGAHSVAIFCFHIFNSFSKIYELEAYRPIFFSIREDILDSSE